MTPKWLVMDRWTDIQYPSIQGKKQKPNFGRTPEPTFLKSLIKASTSSSTNMIQWRFISTCCCVQIPLYFLLSDSSSRLCLMNFLFLLSVTILLHFQICVFLRFRSKLMQQQHLAGRRREIIHPVGTETAFCLNNAKGMVSEDDLLLVDNGSVKWDV